MRSFRISRSILGAIAGVALTSVACSDSSGPAVSTLQNDNFNGAGAAFSGGFVAGEAAAARLGPQSSAYTIRKVMFLFGGNATPQTVDLLIYQDVGTDNPGTLADSSAHALTPSDAVLQEIDLSSASIQVAANATVRVVVKFRHTGAPSVGYDSGLTTGRNFLFVSGGTGWVAAETIPIAGDFIIRMEIETP